MRETPTSWLDYMRSSMPYNRLVLRIDRPGVVPLFVQHAPDDHPGDDLGFAVWKDSGGAWPMSADEVHEELETAMYGDGSVSVVPIQTVPGEEDEPRVGRV